MALKTEGIIGESTTLIDVFRVLSKVAPTDSTVLITGESGTGKELLVRALHSNSDRADKAFVPINCGAIPKDLLESELFGHEKGAFTHALRTRPGRFELADGGTVFLDEIGEMDLTLQVKILRVLQEKEIERVGGVGVRKVDVRVVAATNRDLEAEVEAGRFREDLYYRLNVIPLHLPPLRERGEDIDILASHFMQGFCKKKNRPTLNFTPEVRRILCLYPWPGNVRELENIMERLSILCDGETVQKEDLPKKILDQIATLPREAFDFPLPEEAAPRPRASDGPARALPLEEAAGASELVSRPSLSPSLSNAAGEFIWPVLADLQRQSMNLKDFLDTIEEKLLVEALAGAAGVKNQAAEALGIKRTTLIEKLKKRNMDC